MIITFRGNGNRGLDDLLQINSKRLYHTATSKNDGRHQFSILSSGPLEGDRVKVRQDRHMIWWRPFALTFWGRASILAAPLLFIIALELLNRHSTGHNGIASVATEGYAHYAWVYIPALAMVGVSALYVTADFAVMVLQPYSELRRESVSATASIMDGQFGKTAVHGLWNSLAKRQIAVSATKLSLLISPILTIAVSGLYTATNVNSSFPIELDQLDSFDNSASGSLSPTAGVAQGTPGLIEWANLSYPAWTFETFALPELQIHKSNSGKTLTALNGSDYLTARIPANVGVMNCTVVPPDQLTVTTAAQPVVTTFTETDNDQYGPVVIVREKSRLPCEYGDDPDSEQPLYMEIPSSGEGYFGTVFGRGYFGDSQANFSSSCAQLVTTFGHIGADMSDPVVSVALCNPYIQQIDVETTFIAPNFTIDQTRPPRPYEESAITITPDTSDLDEFSQALVFGRDGIPAAEMVGPDNAQKWVNASERLYAMIVAQVLNAGERIPRSEELFSPPDPPLPPIFPATLTTTGNVQLVQSPVSTRILQAVLGLIFLCGVVAFLAMRTGRILPKNPCSIGAVASLLADSRMLSDTLIPPGSEWCDDGALREKGVFVTQRFSLGWWDDNVREGGEQGVRRRRFGIDVEHFETE